MSDFFLHSSWVDFVALSSIVVLAASLCLSLAAYMTLRRSEKALAKAVATRAPLPAVDAAAAAIATHPHVEGAENSGPSSVQQPLVGVVTEIAYQSNMLALNALVESVRAGDAGVNLAHLAKEVRALADGCEEAAQSLRAISAGGLSGHPGLRMDAMEVLDVLTNWATAVSGFASNVTSAAGNNPGLTAQNDSLHESLARQTEALATSIDGLQSAVVTAQAQANQPSAPSGRPRLRLIAGGGGNALGSLAV